MQIPPAPAVRAPLTATVALAHFAEWTRDDVLTDAEVRSLIKSHPAIERARAAADRSTTAAAVALNVEVRRAKRPEAT